MCSMKFLKNKIFTLERKKVYDWRMLSYLSICFVFSHYLNHIIVNSEPNVKVPECYLINGGI